MKNKSPKEKAGVVVYQRHKGSEPHLLIISARKFKNQWVFPVGSVEKGETLDEAARRECAEESGYVVTIEKKLTSIMVQSKHRVKRFTFFLSTVAGQMDQWETDRRIKWLPASEVVATLPEIFQGVAREAIDQLKKNTT